MTDTPFFYILRKALWNTEEKIQGDLSEAAVERLFVLAEQQAVQGLVYDVLLQQNTRLPQQKVFEAIGVVEQIKQQSRVVNNAALRLNKLMTEYGVRYVIVKGQVVASYYPDSLLRQAGDIDYYCDEKNYLLSQKIIEKNWGVDVKRDGAEMHACFDYRGVTYEGHFMLTNLYNKKRNTYWQTILDFDKGISVIIEGHEVRTLSPTLHTLYVFIHLYNHLQTLGVGLRQFCDIAVMLHQCKSSINMDDLHKHLYVLGLERAYRACGSILVDYLGLPENELGCPISEKDRHYGEKIMKVVMYRGNMGHYNKHNGFSGWKHKVEASGIKVSHFMKFAPLSPGYSFGWLWHEIKRNV